MKSVEEQFKKCKEVFVGYKIFVPTLIALIMGLTFGGFTFGQRLTRAELSSQELKNSHELLLDIKTSLDSLMKQGR